MFTAAFNYEGYGTWYMFVTSVYNNRVLRQGVRLLRELMGPITPGRALCVVGELIGLFGPPAPEVAYAAMYFFLLELRGPGGVCGFDEFVTPNLLDIERLRAALIEFVFNNSTSWRCQVPADRRV
ncbi:uncharacterized protein LOC123267778 [Cotesia glomerata]|uniref:Uncharacterized protein n=1 Tax=Cotesia glomerata TaxID=32391 RepID=A0AAV7HUN5_COTGL|nr:uncharacterized protein LOC123267778 [Cotesia glomerata]KAH0535131.1 hypothetical protein KQX54_013930 [Cotesia glomerata]